MFQTKARIDNALIRCTRKDEEAMPLFEIANDDLGLWVLELDCQPQLAWDIQLERIWSSLVANRLKLASLKDGSTDYALHISTTTDEQTPLRIPNKISCLAAECGFDIEIYASPHD